MSALTNYAEDALGNHLLRNVALTSPTTVYVGLYTAPPGETGGGTEVTGGAYARQAVTFGAPATPGVFTNSADVTFPTATANWGTVTDFAILDAVSAGNMLIYGTLTASKIVNNGDVFKFLASNLTVNFT